MKIYLLEIPENLTFDSLKPYLSCVSDKRREVVLRFTPEEARIRSLLAGLLVRYCVTQDLGLSNDEMLFSNEAQGKPFLINHPDYHFSLSHSGNYVVVASDNHPIGVDVEEMGKPRDGIAKRFFTPSEQAYVQAHGKPGFYEIWTKKEAYVKFLGTGFSKSISSFDVFTTPDVFFYSQPIRNYMLTVCSEEAFPETLSITEVPLRQLCRLFLPAVN